MGKKGNDFSICNMCGASKIDDESSCLTCSYSSGSPSTYALSEDENSVYDFVRGDVFYENGMFYEGPFPVPNSTKEEWFDNNITNLVLRIPVTLDAMVDSQGRRNFNSYLMALTGVKLKDVSHCIQWEDTIEQHKTDMEDEQNVLVLEVEGLLVEDSETVDGY